ncbi:MAG: hypothetical protein M1335_05760 [Chloroflexi bacterium]|nr:hypothetical protein [Chloroflexota bacterium]
MTRHVRTVAYDLAVAVISIGLLIATPVWLAMREITAFHAIFMMIGSALGATIGILKSQLDKEPWPITIFARIEKPAQKTVRPSLTDWLRSLDWTGSARRA